MLTINQREAKRLDRVFVALASERRRRIVQVLALLPASIGQLAKEQRSSLPAIHRHIKLLERAGLVRRRRSGRVNFLALDRSGLALLQEWARQFHTFWGSDEETLENYIAGLERSAPSPKPKRKR